MTRNQLLQQMCCTYRHDFGIISMAEQKGVVMIMEQLLEHCIDPLLEDLRDDVRCGCQHCLSTVVSNMDRLLGNYSAKPSVSA